ncbi:MAG TPA: hypothetical protein VH497_07150 [Vicinamibacterales bacterium]
MRDAIARLRPATLPALALSLSVLHLHTFSVPISAEPGDAFTLGVMRRDGALIPFAVFDGKHWDNNWPPPATDLIVPITRESIPKRWWGDDPPSGDWQLWTQNGPAPVHVTQPDWVQAHCARQVVLRTDYRSPERPPGPREQPYPKDGVAVSPARKIEPIEIVNATALLLPAEDLRQKFNSAELEVDRNFGHPISRKVREPVDPSIEAMYAFGDNPRAFYVESSRLYRTMGDEGCTAIAFGTGWFVKEGAKVKWLDMAVDLLRCNKYGASYMLPLGAIRTGDRTFWVVQYSGWDHERYVVVEVKKNRVEALISAYGGGC